MVGTLVGDEQCFHLLKFHCTGIHYTEIFSVYMIEFHNSIKVSSDSVIQLKRCTSSSSSSSSSSRFIGTSAAVAICALKSGSITSFN
jgi:hypothetical protein